jgi:hypothetical protein
MKKLIVVSLVVIMLAVSVAPAFAAGRSPADRGTAAGSGNIDKASFGVCNPYALSGTISSIDETNRTVTVAIACGNSLVQPYLGQNVTLQTTANTRFLVRNADVTVTPITFEDLVEGQNVSSHGTLLNSTWTATRVTMGAQLYCLP